MLARQSRDRYEVIVTDFPEEAGDADFREYFPSRRLYEHLHRLGILENFARAVYAGEHWFESDDGKSAEKMHCFILFGCVPCRKATLLPIRLDHWLPMIIDGIITNPGPRTLTLQAFQSLNLSVNTQPLGWIQSVAPQLIAMKLEGLHT